MNRNISVPLWQWHWEASTKKTAAHNLDQTWLGRKKYFCFSAWLKQVKGPWEYGAAFEKVIGPPVTKKTAAHNSDLPEEKFLCFYILVGLRHEKVLQYIALTLNRSNFPKLKQIWSHWCIMYNWPCVCIYTHVCIFASSTLCSFSVSRLPQDAVCGKSAS